MCERHRGDGRDIGGHSEGTGGDAALRRSRGEGARLTAQLPKDPETGRDLSDSNGTIGQDGWGRGAGRQVAVRAPSEHGGVSRAVSGMIGGMIKEPSAVLWRQGVPVAGLEVLHSPAETQCGAGGEGETEQLLTCPGRQGESGRESQTGLKSPNLKSAQETI